MPSNFSLQHCGLDRNGLVCNNILELACNPSTVYNQTELHTDPTYDVTDKFPDWMKREMRRQERIAKILKWYQNLHWGWKLGLGIAFLAIAIGVTVGTGGSGAAGVVNILIDVAIGVGVGVGLYTAGSLLMGTFTWEGVANAALDAFLITSAMVFVSSSINAIKYACRGQRINTAELKQCANQCFIAGTLVQSEDGLKKIEDIKVGDKVLAYNEETGEQSYKTVLHLFRNESKDWTGVTVNDKEIVSTPGHKYYLPLTEQWVSAEDLKAGDMVLLSNGQYAKVQKTRAIHYDTPQTTYNFEVEDFHTYYVETGVLVHNKNCSNTVTVDSVDDALNVAEQHLGPKQHYYKNNKNILVSDADPTKIVRFDIDLHSPHVKSVGQHLNIETYAKPFGTSGQRRALQNIHVYWRNG